MCSCVHLRGEPVSSYFSLACSVVSHWCKWCMCTTCLDFGSKIWEISAWLQRPGCSHGISVHCKCVQISSLYAAKWPALPSYMQLILLSWYVANMLCCLCWIFSLSDALPIQSYPSKIWVLCQCGRADLSAAQLICFLPIFFSTWNRWCDMANTLKMLTS